MPDQSQKNRYFSIKETFNQESLHIDNEERYFSTDKNEKIKYHISELWKYLNISPRDLVSVIKMDPKYQESEILSRIFSKCFCFFDKEEEAQFIVCGLKRCKSALSELSVFIPPKVAGFLMEIHITIMTWEKYLDYLWWQSQGGAESSPEFVSLVEKIKQLEEIALTAIEASTLSQETQN